MTSKIQWFQLWYLTLSTQWRLLPLYQAWTSPPPLFATWLMLMTNDMETHKFWIVCHLMKRQVQSAAAISESVLIAEIKSKKGRIISVFHSRSVLYYIIYNDKVQEKQKGISGWWYTDIHNILNSLSFCTYFGTCSSCFSLRWSARYSGFLFI